MTDVLESARKYKNITERYEVVRTVEIVRDGRDRFRIDVIKKSKEGNMPEHYDVECWYHSDVYVQPSYPRSEEAGVKKFDTRATDVRVLIRYDIPWLSENTPEGALRRAINYLATGEIG